MLRTCLMIGAVALAGALPVSAFAQSQSLFGSSGPRGQSSSGQSASALSSGTGGGGGLGTGGMGGAGRSGAGGAGGFAGPQLNQTGDLSSQAVGNGTGFVGRSRDGGFVGNRMAGGGGGAGVMQPSFGGLGGGGGNFGGAGFNNQNETRQGSAASRTFRPRYRLGFEYQPAAGHVSQRAAVQVERLTATHPALAGVQIAIGEGGVAEIRGQAPTAAAKRLIENLVRLEPGVRRVNNLIEVVPAAPNAVSP